MTKSDKTDETSGKMNRRSLVKAGASLAVGAAISPLLAGASAQAQTHNGKAKTLILASHPYPERSVVNKALWEVAQKADDTYFRNLESIYGDNMHSFDVAAEHALYHDMERLVFIYPTHWFNLTPMLKAYLNEVWGLGRPAGLRGKELLIVTTTGADRASYQPNGRLGFTIEQVLTPLHTCANYTGMIYSPPLAFQGVSGSETALRNYQDALTVRLREAPRKA